MDGRSYIEWKGVNCLSLFECHDPQAASSSYSTDGQTWKVTDHVMEQIAWNLCTRRLVNQTYGCFMQLQKLAVQEQSESGQLVSANVLMSSSRQYLAALHECVLGLRKMAEEEERDEDEYMEEDEDDEESEVSKQASLYAMLELAWHLCQVIFLEPLPAGCLIQQLQEWVTWNCMTGKEEMEEVLSSASPDELGSYWGVIYRLVLQGCLGQVVDLLQKNSGFHQHSNAFTVMQKLLERAPMLQSTASLSRAELRRRWSDWRREVARRKQAGEFTLVPPLHRLARILSGDEEVFLEDEILDCCGDWYELMVGKLLYTCPLVMTTDYELCYTADWSRQELARFRGEEDQVTEGGDPAMDKLLLAALHNDFMEVIQLCSSKIPNWWFAAHLANLLYHKGLLTRQRLESASKLCEFLLVEYSCILMGHQSLWELALGYLAHCPEQGQHIMQLLLRKVPMSTEKKASKVLQLCKKYQLKESIVADLCKVMAMNCYRNGRIGAALSWCIKGKNSVFAAFLAEKYMESFDCLGEFVDLDLLDHLDGVMLMNKKLMFLAEYRKYHKHYENEEFVEAGKLLSKLLISENFPERFLPTLLSDVHGLLNKEDLVFDVKQTFALSHFVVQLTLEPPLTISTSASPRSKNSMEDLMPVLQLALVNNLSRATLESSN